MVDPEAVEALKVGGDTWRRYRQQEVGWGDLRGADLRGAHLNRANLTKADLGGAHLSGAYLVEAKLRGADLTKADLGGAHLTNADLSGAELSGVDLSEADLGGARLADAILSGANLRGADLSEADLSGVDLGEADLSGANLTLANLTGAKLSGANLDNASLFEADLGGTDLTRATLGGANLIGANLDNARFAGTQLGNLDLSKTTGLDEAVHDGPSSVGVDTLYRSSGEIPDKFLREVGMTDLFVTYARDTINAEAGPLFPYYSAFLSYSHTDREPVQAIYEQLTKRGIPCWLDEHQLRPSDKIGTNVDRAIRGADKVMVFCSKASLSPGSNWWVDREIERALDEERERARRKETDDISILLPVDLDGYLFSDECTYALKRDLTRRIAATYQPGDDPTDSIVQALSTADDRPYRPFFDPKRHARE